jgi:hypothetical protein
MDTMYALGLIANLILCISIVYLLIEKIENSNNVKIPYLSLGLLLLYVFIILLTIIVSKQVDIASKIFYFITFVSICGLLYLKIKNHTSEGYCNKYIPYQLPKEYKKYYEKVMNRGKNEYVQPYKSAFER